MPGPDTPAPARPTGTSPTRTPTTANRGSRLVWADVAKGASILLVVLHHATTKHYAPGVPVELGFVAEAWLGLTSLLKPVRMPLFFVISGIFAANAVRRPWADSWRRAASPYYLYVVWLLILGAVFSVERTLPMNRTQDLGELVQDLVWASTGVWFLYALAVYFLVARLVRGLPTHLVLAGALAVAVAGALAPIDEVNRQALLLHLVHFLVGVRLPELVRRAAGLRAVTAAGLVAAYLLGTLALSLVPLPRQLDLVLLSAVGVVAGLALAGLASRRAGGTRSVRSVAWVGRHTLPVYVLHMPVLAVLQHAGVAGHLLSGPFAAWWVVAYPALVTAAIVVLSLAVHRVLVGLGVTGLFALPTGPGAARPAGSRSARGPQAEAASASS